MATRSQAVALRKDLAGYTRGFVKSNALLDLLHITGRPIEASTNYNYFAFNRGDGRRLIKTESSRDNPVGNVVSYGGTPTNGTLKFNRISTQPYDANDDEYIWRKLKGGVGLAHNEAQLSQMNRLKAAIDGSTIISTDNVVTIDLTSTSTKAVKLMQDAISAVQLEAGGPCRVHILWGRGALLNFNDHATVQGRINGGASRSQPANVAETTRKTQRALSSLSVDPSRAISLAALDALLMLGTVSELSTAAYNSAGDNVAVSNAWLLNNSAYIAAVSPEPMEEDPGAVKWFAKDQAAGIYQPVFGSPHGNNLTEQATFTWEDDIVLANPYAFRKVNFTV